MHPRRFVHSAAKGSNWVHTCRTADEGLYNQLCMVALIINLVVLARTALSNEQLPVEGPCSWLYVATLAVFTTEGIIVFLKAANAPGAPHLPKRMGPPWISAVVKDDGTTIFERFLVAARACRTNGVSHLPWQTGSPWAQECPSSPA